MKNLYFLFLFLVAYADCQTLIDQSIWGSYGTIISKTNGVYFNASTDGTIPTGAYFLDQSENVSLLLENASIQFEYNGDLYLKRTVDHEIHKMDLASNTTSLFYSDPNIFIISKELREYNSNFYFVGYNILDNDFSFMSLDGSGALSTLAIVPGPVGNGNRLHIDAGIFYYFTNTLQPLTSHHYKFDPSSGVASAITQTEYQMHPCPLCMPISEIDLNGEIFTINNDGQLVSNLTNMDLTCFELIGEENIPIPKLLGSIGQNIYMTLDFSDGSPNALYRFPEDLGNGLCGNSNELNVVMNFDGIDDNIFMENTSTGIKISFMAWFKSDFDNGAFEDRIISYGGDNRFEVGIAENGNFWIFDQSYQNDPIEYNFVRDGLWHHFAVFINGSGRTVYLDFQEVDQFISGNDSYGPDLRIGAWAPGTAIGTEFTGEMDDVLFFDTGLTYDEMCTIVSGDLSVAGNSKSIHFDFEEGNPNSNNQSLTTVLNQGFLQDGLLFNFALSGNSSNYVEGISLLSNDCNLTSSTDLVLNELLIEPNPTHSQIEVKNLKNDINNYEIFSLDGNTIIKGRINLSNPIIDVLNLSQGVYFLKIFDRKNIFYSTKFIKI
ncbi:MAG: hypothetical protein ACJATI_001042 [Halioglobus sp.]|jgi:hypothetical protein